MDKPGTKRAVEDVVIFVFKAGMYTVLAGYIAMRWGLARLGLPPLKREYGPIVAYEPAQEPIVWGEHETLDHFVERQDMERIKRQGWRFKDEAARDAWERRRRIREWAELAVTMLFVLVYFFVGVAGVHAPKWLLWLVALGFAQMWVVELWGRLRGRPSVFDD